MKVKLANENFTSDYGKNLLLSRGVSDISSFMCPTLKNIQSYKDLEHIPMALATIDSFREITWKTQRIALIVDCDVDGYTSAAILYQYLKRIAPNFEITYYLHKGKAHGLEEHWEQLLAENYDLIILPDAGSNDRQYAEKFKCPILVLDHHLVEEAPSPNMVVVNNQSSPNYHNKFLSGAGVTWQFCRAMDEFYGVDYAMDYIDLAALGIDGDMMSGLETENQAFWHLGFSNIKNYFFLSIARKQAYSITGQMAPSDATIMSYLNPISVAFYIVPLINAMVRIGSMEEKTRMFEAFIDGHKMIPCQKRGAKGTLEEAAVESTRECVNARTHQKKMQEDAVARLEQKIFKYDLLENRILFVRLDPEDKFPSELNGLIAMNLAAKYNHPTIVARLNSEGYIRGSIRGLNHSEMGSFKDFLDSTGLCEYVMGHDNAAGVSIKNADLSHLHEIANKELAKYDFGEDYYEVQFERQAYSNDLSDLIEDISSYKNYWSTMNEEPLIYVRDLHFNAADIQVMGKNNDTIKIMKNGIAYMKFFAKDMIEELKHYTGDIKMEVVGKANLNTWMGTVTPQIFIENYEIKEDKETDF